MKKKMIFCTLWFRKSENLPNRNISKTSDRETKKLYFTRLAREENYFTSDLMRKLELFENRGNQYFGWKTP